MEKMLNKYEALRNVIDYLELDAENSRFFCNTIATESLKAFKS